MSSNRDRLTATPIKALKKTVDAENAVISTGSGNFLKIEEGSNKFRIFPRLPGDESYLKMRCVRWMTLEGDDGKERRATVLDGKMHGGLKKDIIDEYIEFCKLNLDSTDPSDKAKIMALTAYDGGMSMTTSWICYAKKIQGDNHTFGFLEVKKTVRDQMNQASIIEDEDEAIETDPFTDPNEGLPLTIKYEKKKYNTVLGKKPSPLTDEEIDEYLEKKPLSELPIFLYTHDDFEKALDGLRFFDEKNDVNLFESEEFQSIVKKQARSFKKSTSDTEEPIKVGKKKFVKDDEDEDEAPFETKKKSVADDEDEDEPVIIKKKKPVVIEDDEDEDEEEEEVVVIKKKKPVVVEEDDEDEEEPVVVKKKKVIVEEEEEEEEEVVIKKPKSLDEIKAKIKSNLGNKK